MNEISYCFNFSLVICLMTIFTCSPKQALVLLIMTNALHFSYISRITVDIWVFCFIPRNITKTLKGFFKIQICLIPTDPLRNWSSLSEIYLPVGGSLLLASQPVVSAVCLISTARLTWLFVDKRQILLHPISETAHYWRSALTMHINLILNSAPKWDTLRIGKKAKAQRRLKESQMVEAYP